MNQCYKHIPNILLYLDNELTGNDLESFRAHLEECVDCMAKTEAERALSVLLRRSRPLYPVSERLRATVNDIVAGNAESSHSAPNRTIGLLSRIVRVLGRTIRSGRLTRLNWSLAATGFVTTVVLIAFAPNMIQRVRAAEYVETAVSTHKAYVGGSLPLQMASDSPREVAAWFDGKIPFHLKLADPQLVSNGRAAYRLSGARLVSIRNGKAAWLAYRSQGEIVSLLVCSRKTATAANGDELRSGGVIFHYISKRGFNIITWTNHDLTYALVSSLHGSAEHSCLVCHQNLAGQDQLR
jgi:anti-sigma factor (TIGR02949 family)